MPPRKSTATGEDDEGPTLKLIMEKGPLSGQTLGFRPGSLIRIGRLVRGNTLSIKDVGISSKHLLIQFEAGRDPARRRWTVTDLDSSNGSVLNDLQLEPSEPAVLSDGDIIKIGEQTSIKVKFEGDEAENAVSSKNVRRNARRRGRIQGGDLGVIDEDAELGLGNNVEEEKIGEVGEIEVKQESSVITRRARSSRKNECALKDLNVKGNQDLGLSEVKESRGVSTRRTRSSAKEEGTDNIGIDLSVIDGKRTRRGAARGRIKLPVETPLEETEKEEHKTTEEEKITSEVEVNKPGEDVKSGAAGLASTSGVKEGNVDTGKVKTVADLEEEGMDDNGTDLNVIDDKRMRRGGARGRKKLPVETLLEETEKEHNMWEEEKTTSEVEVNECVDDVKSGQEGAAAGLASTSGVKEGNFDSGREKMVADLENMTLGEWLDFLEVHLPQQIIDETEEMIAEMRRKAERFHEFMMQQKNAKGKSEVAKE